MDIAPSVVPTPPLQALWVKVENAGCNAPPAITNGASTDTPVGDAIIATIPNLNFDTNSPVKAQERVDVCNLKYSLSPKK